MTTSPWKLLCRPSPSTSGLSKQHSRVPSFVLAFGMNITQEHLERLRGWQESFRWPQACFEGAHCVRTKGHLEDSSRHLSAYNTVLCNLVFVVERYLARPVQSHQLAYAIYMLCAVHSVQT